MTSGVASQVMIRARARSILLKLSGVRPFDARADRRLASTRLLSVDAFDTLITRVVMHPTDVFAICGIILRRREIIDIEPSAWRDRRHEAESEIARESYPREVRLDEIYDRLQQAGLLSAGHKNIAREIECDVERCLSRPIAEMIDMVNGFLADGGSATILSDTSLPESQLADLLKAAGLALGRNAIHASSRSGATKRSGAMFRSILSRAEHRAGSILHVGDNHHSDYRQARRARLAAAPYLASRPTRFERRLHDSLPMPELLGSIIAGSARATRLGRFLPDPHRQAIWDLSSNVTGPLLFSFVAWTLREAKRRGIRTLYFFSRDGEILLRIAHELQQDRVAPIECRYLHVSRQSLHLPGVTELGDPEREWILDNAGRNNLSYLLRRLDIAVDEFIGLLPAQSDLRRLDPEAPMTQAGIRAVSGCLDLAAVRTLILDRAARRRVLCLDYMKDQHLLAPGQIGVVDIGWRGRLQRSLCRAISTVEPAFPERLHGFYIDLDRPPTDAGSFSAFSTLCGTGFSWASRGSLFEIFCAAQHGTVRRYERGQDGVVAPLLASDTNPEAATWGLAIQQEAIVAFCRNARLGLELAQIDMREHVPELAKAAVEVVRLFVSRPAASEAAAFGSFTHFSDEQHDLVEQMAGPIDFRPHALLKRLGPAYREQRISYWPEGSLARSVPEWLRGVALSMLRAMPGRHA